MKILRIFAGLFLLFGFMDICFPMEGLSDSNVINDQQSNPQQGHDNNYNDNKQNEEIDGSNDAWAQLSDESNRESVVPQSQNNNDNLENLMTIFLNLNKDKNVSLQEKNDALKKVMERLWRLRFIHSHIDKPSVNNTTYYKKLFTEDNFKEDKNGTDELLKSIEGDIQKCLFFYQRWRNDAVKKYENLMKNSSIYWGSRLIAYGAPVVAGGIATYKGTNALLSNFTESLKSSWGAIGSTAKFGWNKAPFALSMIAAGVLLKYSVNALVKNTKEGKEALEAQRLFRFLKLYRHFLGKFYREIFGMYDKDPLIGISHLQDNPFYLDLLIYSTFLTKTTFLSTSKNSVGDLKLSIENKIDLLFALGFSKKDPSKEKAREQKFKNYLNGSTSFEDYIEAMRTN